MVKALMFPSLGLLHAEEKGSGHCFPFSLFPTSVPPLTKLLMEGKEGKGQESSDLNSVAVNQHLLSGPAECLNLTLFLVVDTLEPVLPSLRVSHLQLTRQE